LQSPSGASPDLAPQEEKRSKRGNVFAFLTLKEPSQQAFQEYAQLQRQQAALKSTSSAKLATVSQQKLPVDVPKVNSKWDGMPNNAPREGWKRSMDYSIRSRNSPKPSTDTIRKTTSARSSSSKSSSSSKRTVKQETPATPRARVKDDDELPDLSRLDSLGDATSDMPIRIRTPEITDLSVSHLPPQTEAIVPDLYFSPQNRPPKAQTEPTGVNPPSESSLSSSPLTPADTFSPLPQSSASHKAPKASPILKVQRFKSVEEIPQWPLVTNPEDVIILSADERSPARHSPFHANEAVELRTPESSMDAYFDESYFPPDQSQPSYPSPDPDSYSSDFSHHLTPYMSPGGRSYRHGLLIPPRRIPGRAVIKDTDLATIPESDTASILNRAPTIGGGSGWNSNRNSVISVDNMENSKDTGRISMAESRASSEVSGQWYQSPKERKGLGGFVKAGRQRSDWPMPGEEDEEYVVEGGPSLSPAKNRHGRELRGARRTSLMGVFKR